jgi:hypothetical protein
MGLGGFGGAGPEGPPNVTEGAGQAPPPTGCLRPFHFTPTGVLSELRTRPTPRLLWSSTGGSTSEYGSTMEGVEGYR